jgi:response regulator RpfG family c-di-GMP phosphodiesterase
MECDHCIIRLQPSRDQAVALIALEHEVPSAVILDHALSDGERSQLRDLLKERNIPYVVHSGYAAPERGDAAGNDVNVPKPASPQLLITKVAGLLYSRNCELGARA